MKYTPPSRVRFGVFELDLKAGELYKETRRGTRKVRLQEQPFLVLRILIDGRGEVVRREEIQAKLWPNDTMVEFDHGINTAIKKLRSALDDSAEDPKYIETVARRGYRLMMPIDGGDSISDYSPALLADGGAPDEGAGKIQLKPGGLAGKTISHYRVLHVIGGGGMGVVYKAEDLKLGRAAALKFLPEEVVSNARALERFEREARTASSLNHPNICTIYEIEEHQGQPFIVMELLEGFTLRERLAAATSVVRLFSIDEVLSIALQLSKGLEAAHEKGIIHRDIKPANIFVTNMGVTKILDFGLAKLLQPSGEPAIAAEPEGKPGPPTQAVEGWEASETLSLSRAGVAIGTAAYMSPEQVRGEKLDARSDLFSFGLVLYEMTTGQAAFEGNTLAALHDAILNGSPTTPEQLNPDLPAELQDVIQKCLEKDRDRRYQTAAEVRSVLEKSGRRVIAPIEHALQGSNVAVTSPTVADEAPGSTKADERMRWWLGQRWILATACIILLIAILAAWYIVPRIASRTLPPQPIQSIAVLPLANLSADPDQEYFSEGLTDALITDLAKIGTLRVVSRTSIIRYRGTSKTAREIARELGVDALVEGTLERDHNRVRIRAQLIHGRTDQTLWAASYDRDVSDLFRLEGDVADDIAEQIGHRVTVQGIRPAKNRTVSTPVYEDYLRGRYYWNKRTAEDLAKAIALFERVIQQDPDFAPAYSGLADSYNLLTVYSNASPQEAYPKAKAAALKALQLDDTLAAAHASLGEVLFRFDWNWADAEKEFRRSIELEPSYSIAHHWYAEYLIAMGRFAEGVGEIQKAQNWIPFLLSSTRTRVGFSVWLA